MIKNFQYRLHPTKKQARLFEKCLSGCQWLYNELLSQRKIAFDELGMRLTKYQQMMFLPLLKEEYSDLDQIHSQVLQNAVDRLDKAFQGFFRRCKAGEKPGFPRFKGKHRYNSFCFPQSGFTVEGRELKLSKMGRIRIRLHRPLEGQIKTCTLRKNPSGTWDVVLSCEVTPERLPTNEKSVGIDVGIATFAVLTDGQEIQNPRFFKHDERVLAKAQKKLSKLEKGTKKRRAQGKVVAKIHERIKSRRKDFATKNREKLLISINISA